MERIACPNQLVQHHGFVLIDSRFEQIDPTATFRNYPFSLLFTVVLLRRFLFGLTAD
jgi:hypothetical protein